MNLTIYRPASVAPDEFVAYWSAQYPKQEDVLLYTPNINDGRSPRALYDLFLWKSGAWLAKKWRKAVETKIIPRFAELNTLPEDISAADFLRRFSEGGAIFRIFLLHCWWPKRFPIYDQHVHRAMSVAKTGQCEEIEGWPDDRKIDSYLRDYLPFHSEFATLDQRSVDQALWAFGKFLKTSRLPGGCRRRH